ncbi:hypothetical protein HGI30_14750 [Paenibacillus albicereus]|uniref:Uncharacterized protein n=1 Tax=Paenibacillus albicereus TaxID=2726185 RepID=A0A6H2GZ77_9BACL|nr:hypothetical protein [Paenibacillus albicereus]QJC52697.1 hypothetical protein HGI30_14750 [Paenibacillus albicereus]
MEPTLRKPPRPIRGAALPAAITLLVLALALLPPLVTAYNLTKTQTRMLIAELDRGRTDGPPVTADELKDRQAAKTAVARLLGSPQGTSASDFGSEASAASIGADSTASTLDSGMIQAVERVGADLAGAGTLGAALASPMGTLAAALAPLTGTLGAALASPPGILAAAPSSPPGTLAASTTVTVDPPPSSPPVSPLTVSPPAVSPPAASPAGPLDSERLAELKESLSEGQGALWAGHGLLLALLCALVSKRLTGRYRGLLVNERNVMSLSRFQTVIWTVLLLSAYYTAASLRAYGLADPTAALQIDMDWQLWALMGISVTSLVAAPVIHAQKQDKQPDPAAAAKLDPEQVAAGDGILLAKPRFQDAAWNDLFQGEELKTAGYVDLAKLQLFFFTLVGAAAYSVLLLQLFGTVPAEELGQLPTLGQGFLAVLGISHAGYLASKTVDRTQTAGD